MSKTLVILNCTKSKNRGRWEARKLYDKSAIFRKFKDYCKKYQYDYIIISAKYGVLFPTSIIEYYDKTLKNKKDINELAQKLKTSLPKIIDKYDKIIVFCSQKYVKAFSFLIATSNDKFSFPLKHLRIGERSKWLSKKIK